MTGTTGAGLPPEARPALDALARRIQATGLRPGLTPRRLERAVADAAAERGQDPAAFASSAAAGTEALQDVLDLLTVQETDFFREPKQLAALRDHVLPELRGPVTAWSAGCANGQEAWTLAVMLAQAGVPSWQVVATDISTAALARAEAGVYSDDEASGLAEGARSFFVRQGDSWSVVPALRQRVRFAHHNLASGRPPVPAASCQVVLCRNVLIYLDGPGIEAAVAAVAEALAPDGWLVVGASESLWGVTDRLELAPVGDTFLYRRAQGPGRPLVPRPAGAEAAADPDVGDLVAAGRTAADGGDHRGAAQSFRQAAYLDPDRADAHDGLARALRALGDERGAERATAAARAARSRH